MDWIIPWLIVIVKLTIRTYKRWVETSVRRSQGTVLLVAYCTWHGMRLNYSRN